MSDYELELKVKNGPLMARIREAGYSNVNEFAKKNNLSPSAVGELVNLKVPAYLQSGRKQGELRPFVLRVMNVLYASSPLEIFPERHLFESLPQNRFIGHVDENELAQITNMATEDPSCYLERLEAGPGSLNDLIGIITKRELEVLKQHFLENKTLEEMATQFDLSRTRMTQIKKSALRKLRTSSHRDKIIAAFGDHALGVVDD